MKKRHIVPIALCLFLMALLNGCNAVDSAKLKIRQALVDKQAEVYGEQFDTVTEEEKKAAGEYVTVMDYAYSQLPEEEQQLYLELLSILTSYEEDRKLSTMDPDLVDKVYQTIMMDHPELFYLEGYTITEHTVGEKTAFYTFSGQYTRTLEEMKEKQQKVDQKVEQILSGVSSDMSDYDKVKYVYDYIVLNTNYDEDAPDNQNILSVFLNQASVCQGYAYATQYLLKELGIPCTTVTGNAFKEDNTQVSHAWNLVSIDGAYYYVDTTWGDPINSSELEELMNNGYVNYDYLNLTTEQIERDHKSNVPVELPLCMEETYNYYRVEDLYYETYDLFRVKEKLQEAQEENASCLIMKFPGADIYNEYLDRLFEGQEFFKIASSIRSVSYTADPESFLLIIYLGQE